MADLNKIANNIEEILELQVYSLLNQAHAGTLKSYEVKTIETLAKITTICKMWQDKLPSTSPFEKLTSEELHSFFADENSEGDEDDGGEPSSAQAADSIN